MKCPKCDNTTCFKVYFMNEVSYYNDYYCKKCSNVFSYSKSRHKFYKISKERIKKIKGFNQ